jgi:lipoprotein signal peptidase
MLWLRLRHWLAGQMMMRLVALAGTAAFLADWASKSWALGTLAHETAALGWLILGLESNQAFAFSSGAESVSPQLVMGARLTALLAIGTVFGRLFVRDRRTAVGAGLILGGGLGNAVDLAFRGSVVDFIGAGHIYFNVADLAILVGIGLMAPMIRVHALATQRRIALWERRWARDRRLDT